MEYFRIRKPRVQHLASGALNKRPYEIYFASKSHYFAKKRDEKYISKSKSILISGGQGSGKSKELKRLYMYKEKIYQKHDKNFLWLNCSESISDWITCNVGGQVEEYTNEEVDSKSFYIKIQALVNYADKAIVFIDDLDKASGRKLEVIKDIQRVSKQFVATTTNKHHINKTILKIMGKGYHEIELTTDQAKDATNILFVVFLLALVTTGNINMALLITAGRLMLKQSTAK